MLRSLLSFDFLACLLSTAFGTPLPPLSSNASATYISPAGSIFSISDPNLVNSTALGSQPRISCFRNPPRFAFEPPHIPIAMADYEAVIDKIYDEPDVNVPRTWPWSHEYKINTANVWVHNREPTLHDAQFSPIEVANHAIQIKETCYIVGQLFLGGLMNFGPGRRYQIQLHGSNYDLGAKVTAAA